MLDNTDWYPFWLFKVFLEVIKSRFAVMGEKKINFLFKKNVILIYGWYCI